MPSNRRLKATAFIAILTVLILLYISNGAKSTRESPFYTRTVQAIQDRHDDQAHQAVVAEEQARQARVAKIQQEHDKAMEGKAPDTAAGAKQKPIVEDVKDAAAKATTEKAGEGVNKAQDAAASLAGENSKPIAGRKKMDGGKVVINGKADENDGVAKVGNTGPKDSSVVKSEKDDPESEEDHKVEEEMNSILKKGPVIIFSKSYCPFSMKAKHILLDLYTITPPPYVVELDLHEHGPGLQAALLKSTGRRTVPNVLINGRSIGGGDDVQELHENGKLAETVQAMGGKRVMEVKKKPAESEGGGGEGAAKRKEVRFKA